MIVSYQPILFIDFVGSILMIVLSILCLRIVFKLIKRDKNNLIWTYLLWVCIGLTCFAVSRSAGHILKNILFLTDQNDLWRRIRPYSGAVNTFMFLVLGSITLFFERVWKIYQQILKDREALRVAHEELLYMNQNLEKLVDQRTDALVFSEQRYRRIFEVSKDMILVTKKNGSILDMNPAGLRLIGLEDKGSTGLPWAGKHVQAFFSTPNDWKTITQEIQERGFISNAEFDLVLEKGNTKRVLLSGSHAGGGGDDDSTIHFLIKDIEERRLIQEQMAQADKLASIGELSSGIAHEINNPLGIILGYTQLMMRGENNASQRCNDLKTIEKHVRNCKGIVEDLLNFARTSKTKKDVQDIHHLIDDVISFVMHHSNLENINIEKKYDALVSPLFLDEKKIKQVFINLLMNAIHAVGKNGTITLKTGLNGRSDQVVVSVADTGYGIEEKDMPRIFDPFFTTKSTKEGTGLGLSVSYGIIKGHGGNIAVKSIPGKGATFIVSLPLTPQL